MRSVKIVWDRKVKVVELDMATRNIVGRSEQPFIMPKNGSVTIKAKDNEAEEMKHC